MFNGISWYIIDDEIKAALDVVGVDHTEIVTTL
jgi:hypothetical protein